MTEPNAPAAQPRIEVRIAGQFVRDLSFESPNVIKLMQSPPQSPNLNLEMNVQPSQVGPNLYGSAITFAAKATSADTTIYDLELVYAGVFEIKGAPPELLDRMLNIDCPALLFPFLRRIVADLTREGGFPPLMLDPVDFAQLYFQKRQAVADGPPSGKPS